MKLKNIIFMALIISAVIIAWISYFVGIGVTPFAVQSFIGREVHYSDLFILSLTPVIMQGVACFYLIRISRMIGKQLALIWLGKNGLIFINNVIISLVLLIAAQRPTQQPIEIVGILIGFVIPNAVAAFSLMLQWKISKALNPNSVPYVG